MATEYAVASDASCNNPYDDPTFLATSDSPAMELGNTKFSGKNFLLWSRCVVMALGTKNKQDFWTGAVAMPSSTSPKLQQWQRSDHMVHCWSLNSIAQELKENFLKKELRNVAQGNDSVVAYFTKLKRYWDDIDEFEVIPQCDCGAMTACTCYLYKQMLDLSSREKVLNFLMGLSDVYEHPRSNILAMDPIPPLNKVYSIIHQIESHKLISNVVNCSQDDSALNVSKSAEYFSRFSGNAAGNQFPGSTSGGFSDTSHMYSQHPPGSQFFGQSSQYAPQYSPQHGQGSSFQNQQGFVAASYQHQNHPQQSGPHRISPVAQAKYDTPVDVSDASVKFAGITLASPKDCDTCYDTWIIDSGAIDHMTGHKHYFDSLNLLKKLILIGLPGGSSKYVSHGGHITLDSGIRLHDALYVSAFKHNLLSVGKPLLTTGLLLHFTVDKYVIQDPASSIPVGIGFQEKGLYKLKNKTVKLANTAVSFLPVHSADSCNCSKPVTCNNHTDIAVFDARLGHTLLAKMQHIDVVPCKSMKQYECETCLQAKIYRLPFNRSANRAACKF
ncbi:uncharacterized protein LOC141620392 [Silene latifolia]|uniref:uncharacterized protein LOC141620392 n=1 Tax=Silene latifolia TaxID=37657 RepID=UPI003D77C2B4